MLIPSYAQPVGQPVKLGVMLSSADRFTAVVAMTLTSIEYEHGLNQEPDFAPTQGEVGLH